MIRYIKTKRSTQEIISDKMVSDNWFDVYYQSARMEGRRITRTDNTLEVIFTEKDYTVTLIK